MNYAELAELIKDFVESEEPSFVANIPTFVRLAEERIYRIAKIPGVRKRTTGTLASGVGELVLPGDFISADSIEVNLGGVWSHLMPKDQDFLSEAYPSDPQGTPVHYAQLDDERVLIAPRPSEAHQYRLTYVKKPDSIVDGGTNWVTDNAQQALLYGALVEAYTYVKGEPDLLAMYEQRFMDAMGQARMVSNKDTRTNEWRTPPPLGG